MENRRTLYDTAALGTATLPLLFFPATLVTAPVAIYLGIVSFWKPSSVVPRTRVRAWLAILLGLLQLAGWSLVFINMALEQ